MSNLAQSVSLANLRIQSFQVNLVTREIRTVPIVVLAAKKHGPNCSCEACSGLHMKRTKDKRMKAMMPGDVDMGNRQPATMGKKFKAGGPGSGPKTGHAHPETESESRANDSQEERQRTEDMAEMGFMPTHSTPTRGRVPTKPLKKYVANGVKANVPPPKQKVDTIKPSNLMHDKGKILKGKHIGFNKLKNQLSHEKGVTNPGGLAYTIGKDKFGKKGMQKKAAK